MSGDIITPRVTRDTKAVIVDPKEATHQANVFRLKPFFRKVDDRNEYAAAVVDAQIARLISAVESLVEQNEIIIMHLESMSD